MRVADLKSNMMVSASVSAAVGLWQRERLEYLLVDVPPRGDERGVGLKVVAGGSCHVGLAVGGYLIP